MKKILSLLLIAAAFGYSSCSEDDPTSGGAPTLTLSSTTAQDVPGATVTVTVSVDAPNGGKTLQISGPTADVTLSGEKQQDVEVDIDIPAGSGIGTSFSVTFVAIDVEDKASLPVELTITVGDPIVVLGPGDLTTRTLDAGTEYLLKGQVFVPNGVTLTVPAGTVIKGEKASKATLIVKPGGKLICNGTAADPVIFTSNQAVGERDRADWAGIVILGNAYVNQAAQPAIEGISPSVNYGTVGTDNTVNENENNATLTYVRIEYGGIELSPNNETNSLTMGALGRGTTIDHVQASFGGDDGFEWFGGTVDAKYLISFGMWDDDFDTDFGWRGRVQYGLVVRYHSYADQSGSNAFESDTQGGTGVIAGKCDGTATFGCTQGVFSNITVIGPRDYNNGLVRFGETATSRARAINANYQNAMHIRRATSLSIFNSVFTGFPVGLRMDDAVTQTNLNNGNLKLKNNVLLVPSTKVVGTTTTETAVVFSTSNISSGDATFLQTYWNANNATAVVPTGSAAWSPTPGTPANSIDPYVGTGIRSSLFFAGGSAVTTENGRAIPDYAANPDFTLEASGSLLTGADFTDPLLSTFFTGGTTYRGAFNGATDWTDGWTNFLPITTVY